MAELKPAGFFRQLVSVFSPKQMEVQVRTERLPDGQIEIMPVFTIDGHEIPPNLITPDKHQHILGYNVILDAPCRAIRNQTQGKKLRLARSKAGDYLSQLVKSGIDIRSKDGRAACRVESVKPDVKLELGADDTLTIQSELVTSHGVVLEKPQTLDDLKPENGWYSVGDDLLRVETTNTPLDQVLVTKDGNGTLTGDDVPRFLKHLQREEGHVGSVEKNDPLKQLSVLTGKPENRAKLDGDADAVVIQPSLVFPGTEGRKYEQTTDVIDGLEQNGGGFRRVQEGWVEVSPDAIDQFRRDCRELSEKLASSPTIRGTDIPKTLWTLVQTGGRDGWTSPWSAYVSEAVKNAHGLVATPATAEVRLKIIEKDDRFLLELDPVYGHGRYRLTHNETGNATKSGEEWVRQEDHWIKADQDKYREIEERLDQMMAKRGPNGFTCSARQRRKVIESFSTVGSVHEDVPVLSSTPAKRITADGDAESVVVNPSLVFTGTEGRQYEPTKANIDRLERIGGGFHRVEEGWLEVSSDTIAGFRWDCAELARKLGASSTICGADIPKTLMKLSQMSGRDYRMQANPWAVYFSKAVTDAHRLVDERANVEFRLNVVEKDGRSLLELDPIYNHDRFRLSHVESESATNSGEEWVRRRDAWIKVDKEKCRKIEAGIEQLKLERGPTGFTFPASP